MASSSSRNCDTNRRSSAKSSPITDIRAHTTTTVTTTSTNSRNRGSRDRRRSKNKINSSASMAVASLMGNVYDESPSAGNTFLDADFTLVDVSSAASGIVIDADCPPPLPPLRQESFSSSASQSKTVDDVWKDIVAGRIDQREYKEEEDTAPEMMTLEDFLAKASAAEDEEGGDGGGGGREGEGGRVADDVKMSLSERLSGGIFSFDQVSQSPYQLSLQAQGSGSMIAFMDGNGSGSGNGSGVEVNGGGRRKRRALLEPMDKAAEQRQRRMIKNRESAARSRERKQAYQVELESLVSKLEEVNEQLLREMEEHNKARFKQLMEKLVPVVEKRKPARPLRRVQSMQW